MSKWLPLCLAAVIIGGCHDSEREQQAREERLVDTVRAAAERRVPPEEVEAFVGQSAALNTARANDRELLSRVTLRAEDADRSQLPQLQAYHHLAYWVRHSRTHDPRVVGVVWKDDGSAECFLGIVALPQ